MRIRRWHAIRTLSVLLAIGGWLLCIAFVGDAMQSACYEQANKSPTRQVDIEKCATAELPTFAHPFAGVELRGLYDPDARNAWFVISGFWLIIVIALLVGTYLRWTSDRRPDSADMPVRAWHFTRVALVMLVIGCWWLGVGLVGHTTTKPCYEEADTAALIKVCREIERPTLARPFDAIELSGLYDPGARNGWFIVTGFWLVVLVAILTTAQRRHQRERS